MPFETVDQKPQQVDSFATSTIQEAVREAAKTRNLPLGEPEMFEAIPGFGVRAQVTGRRIALGSRRMIAGNEMLPSIDGLEAQGKTILYVACDDKPAEFLGRRRIVAGCLGCRASVASRLGDTWQLFKITSFTQKRYERKSSNKVNESNSKFHVDKNH